MIQNPAVVKLKTDELSELIFSSEECNNLKNEIINLVSEESNLDKMRLKLNNGFKNSLSPKSFILLLSCTTKWYIFPTITTNS